MAMVEPPIQSDPRAAWNHGAKLWDAALTTGADYYRDLVHVPALLAVCGDLTGERVIDLGCGQGSFTRLLARAGGHVTGVDIAEEQIALARRHEEAERLGIEYAVLDAARLADHWPSGSFTVATACMALHDVSDPLGVLRSARAVLAPGGRVLFSIPHPLNTSPSRQWERDAAGRKISLKIDRYFDAGIGQTRWRHEGQEYTTPYWHRPLADWSALIAEAGFLIRRLHEPCPSAELVREYPDLEDCARVPYFLIGDLIAVA